MLTLLQSGHFPCFVIFYEILCTFAILYYIITIERQLCLYLLDFNERRRYKNCI